MQFFLQNKISLTDFDKSVLDKFSYLDDYDVLGAIKAWQFHDDFVLQSLCRMILNRDLLKIQMTDDKPNKENLLVIKINTFLYLEFRTKKRIILFSKAS